MRSHGWLAATGIPLIFLGLGCSPSETKLRDTFGDDVVASAYGDVMTYDSLAAWVPDELSLEDSAAFAERVIARWMRERVMLFQADLHLQREKANLNQALESYRRSLMISTYESKYVASRLDTEITEEEIAQYYLSHPELFTLHDHAVRALHLHLPDPKVAAALRGIPWTSKEERRWKTEFDQLETWMIQADSLSIPKLEQWCVQHGALYQLDHETWWSLGELLDEVPLSLYRVEDQIKRESPVTFETNGRRYFVRFLDHGLKGKTAPLDLAKDQIVELVLQRRRQQLLESLRDTLFQQAWAEGHLTRENL